MNTRQVPPEPPPKEGKPLSLLLALGAATLFAGYWALRAAQAILKALAGL